MTHLQPTTTAAKDTGIVDTIQALGKFAISPLAFSLALIKVGGFRVNDGPAAPLAYLVTGGIFCAGILTLPATIPLSVITSAIAVVNGVALAVSKPLRFFSNQNNQNISPKVSIDSLDEEDMIFSSTP